jgi:hypothetical protein
MGDLRGRYPSLGQSTRNASDKTLYIAAKYNPIYNPIYSINQQAFQYDPEVVLERYDSSIVEQRVTPTHLEVISHTSKRIPTAPFARLTTALDWLKLIAHSLIKQPVIVSIFASEHHVMMPQRDISICVISTTVEFIRM